MNWKAILHSAIVSVASVFVGAVQQYFQTGGVIPQTDAQWHSFLGSVALAALIGIGSLLKQSPIQPKAPVFVFALALILCLGVAPVHAQSTISTPPAPAQIQNLYALGSSYAVGASPAVAGTALYAHNLNTGATLPTFAFTVVDGTPNTLSPFTVTTNIGVGIAQQVATIGKIPIYVPTAAGISSTGSNTGWQWNGGALVPIHLKGNYYLVPSIRFLKSSVSSGSGYQPIVGLLFGWGQ